MFFNARRFSKVSLFAKKRLRLILSLAVLLIVIALIPITARAQPSPFLSPSEKSHYDEEYYMDLDAFSFSRDWEELWLDSPLGYRISAASLDKDNLFIHQELKLEKELLSRFYFEYHLTQFENLDHNILYQNLKLRYRTIGQFWLGIHGQPAYQKKYTHWGMHLLWYKDRRHNLETYFTLIDPLYNEKNEFTDRYEIFPVRAGIVGELTLWDRVRWRQNTFITSMAKRWYPQEQYIERLKDGFADITLEYLGRDRWVAGIRSLYYWREESQESTSYQISPYSFRTRTIIVKPYIELPIGEAATLTPAGLYVRLTEDTDFPREYNSCRLVREDYAASVEINWRCRDNVGLRGGWSSGYISSERRCDRSCDREETFYETQNKLVAKIEIYFKKVSRLIVNLTFDAEEPVHHFWDGGGVMFIAVF